MADNQNANEGEQKSGGNKLTMALGGLLIAVIAGAGGAYSTGMVQVGPTDSAEEEEEEPEEPEVILNEEPSFLPMEKFVVGLSQGGSRNYMVVELSLVSHHPDLEAQMESLDSPIRNAFLKHFSGKGVAAAREEVSNPIKLQNELLQKFRKAAEDYGKELAVEEVILTNVLIQ